MIDTINIVGYDTWYSESPWNRLGTNLKNFDVTYNNLNSNITYFIKDGIFEIEKKYNCNIKIALLTECRIMDSRRHEYLEEKGNLFDYIVTYDDQLIEQFPDKVIITPYGGTWIVPSMQKIYSKSKICSYITSKKTYTEDQHDRISLLDYFYENKNIDIELFGRGHNPISEDHENNIDGKIDALKEFQYSIVIENHQQNNYFSEKLLDCFLTGTIPIYHGCKKIQEYFNIDGMILLDNIQSAAKIIPELNFVTSKTIIEAVHENFNIAKQYIDSLSYSYNILKKKIL